MIGVDLSKVVSDASQFVSQWEPAVYHYLTDSGSPDLRLQSLSDANARELISNFTDSLQIVSYGGHKYFLP